MEQMISGIKRISRCDIPLGVALGNQTSYQCQDARISVKYYVQSTLIIVAPVVIVSYRVLVRWGCCYLRISRLDTKVKVKIEDLWIISSQLIYPVTKSLFHLLNLSAKISDVVSCPSILCPS